MFAEKCSEGVHEAEEGFWSAGLRVVECRAEDCWDDDTMDGVCCRGFENRFDGSEDCVEWRGNGGDANKVELCILRYFEAFGKVEGVAKGSLGLSVISLR